MWILGEAGRQETWSVSPQVLCNSPHWATVSTEMGCTCLSMDLIIIQTLYLLKGSEFHPKGGVLRSREACPSFPSSKDLLCGNKRT